MGYHYAGFEFRNDSVITVDKWEFYHCNRTHPASGAKDSNTTVNLDRPGSFYFVSGDPEHCKNDQRLAVEVYPLHPISDSPPQPISMAPAPSSLSSSSAVSSSVPLSFISALLISDIVAVVAAQVELEDPVENIGASLVRQAASKTNDLAGDGTTTSVVLAQGLIAEGVKVVAAGANPIQIAKGIDRTAKALVSELKKCQKRSRTVN
ncbi:hypothetical protein K7X08_024001 [Anisodus acutangulus]|uniref:Phytocyanin domain-containing protein n=1 Tax=Anisodus acutangulus TaxID=402998 RepID=A0A9Q1M818_9SOLA|nr:hypothetical protein K7X08_024001 [Anisodus acutangulus]